MEVDMRRLDKSYLLAVLFLMGLAPLLSIGTEALITRANDPTWMLIGKWFIFWAVGVRLFTAGIRQVVNPGFTAQQIFKIKGSKVHKLVRELGFANLCLGSIGIISLFLPFWRGAAGLAGALYLGPAGVQHLLRKSDDPNEKVAMISDLTIALLIAIYLASQA
jgi:hypothetical protein